MTGRRPAQVRFGDLGLRVLSGVALAALALFGLWLGGIWVTLFAAVAAVLMLWELHRMVTGSQRYAEPALMLLVVAGAGGVLATGGPGIVWGALCLVLGAALLVPVAGAGGLIRAGWLAGGLIYAGLAMAFLIVIRDDFGLAAVLWIILVVVAADVGAYFAGRMIGGPKLWPRVSPGKTWAGALGGLALALAAGLGFAAATGRGLVTVGLLSIGVGIASQLGDLLESALKRHFGVKDASRLIPGHGGVMDRLDGLMGGLWFFALYDMLGGRLGG